MDAVRPAQTLAVTRGVCRLFLDLGFSPVREVSLPTGRRVDVAGIGKGGEIIVAEVKSGPEDFKTDSKWTEYPDFCDRFFFAVGPDFPVTLVPEDRGLIIADRHGGAVVREGADTPLHASRRKAMTLRLARLAAERLARLADPDHVLT
ncbi:MAG: MmcB family DNA repair protein [Alphaproteobacteria bacterium]